jgi:hypothetical protein
MLEYYYGRCGGRGKTRRPNMMPGTCQITWWRDGGVASCPGITSALHTAVGLSDSMNTIEFLFSKAIILKSCHARKTNPKGIRYTQASRQATDFGDLGGCSLLYKFQNDKSSICFFMNVLTHQVYVPSYFFSYGSHWSSVFAPSAAASFTPAGRRRPPMSAPRWFRMPLRDFVWRVLTSLLPSSSWAAASDARKAGRSFIDRGIRGWRRLLIFLGCKFPGGVRLLENDSTVYSEYTLRSSSCWSTVRELVLWNRVSMVKTACLLCLCRSLRKINLETVRSSSGLLENAITQSKIKRGYSSTRTE